MGRLSDSGPARDFKSGSVANVSNVSEHTPGQLKLTMYSQVKMGDGRHANNAWLQECPDPISTVTWDNFLAISPKRAKNLGLKTHDVVSVQSGGFAKEISILIQPGLHSDTVAAAIGYGRSSSGRVGATAGTDVIPLGSAAGGQIILSGRPVEIKKIGRRYELAITQGHHRTEGRPLINDITLAQYRQDPATENHTNPHLRMAKPPTMWKKHKYSKDYRWAMAVDLNSCTGCSACVVACQAENNIAVVGRENVRVSREMHWIRIDRFYSGSEEDPQVAFQPMMCQHCENASCETVCPVLATVHSDEGLNEMAYNRCVGTRYCQNNCPYKVRRFNFFDHWKDYRPPQNLAWNPDVTVRMRGIMEKCSFCVQRIQEARQVAKSEGRKIKEGDFQVACQQTCPTNAITMGNILDEESDVTRWRNEKRAFRSLEIYNNVPMVSYLTKVRNNERKDSHVPHHGDGGHA